MAQRAAASALREEAPASQSFAGDSQLPPEALQAALDRPVRVHALHWHGGALGVGKFDEN
jgi:hypothetical protein